MFSEDVLASRMYAICSTIFNLMYLTLLFMLFSLPIITIAPAFIALVATIRQPQLNIFPTFFKSFKQNFFRSFAILAFNIASIMFLAQIRPFIGTILMGNLVYSFILGFLIVYNLNAYLLVDLLKKANLTFFRQVFFFTVGTFYKSFFIPIIAAGLVIIFPIIGGATLLLMAVSIVPAIYLKMIKKDLEIIKDYL